MEFSLTPSYSELFNSTCEDPQSFISDYNSSEILTYLSFINAQLFTNNENDLDAQTTLLGKIVGYWPEGVRQQFMPYVSSFVMKTKEKPNFFKSLYITYFVHQELLSFKNGKQTKLDAEGELNVIRAYFGYIEKFNEEFTPIMIKNKGPVGDDLYFQRNTWPFLIKQFDVNEGVDPVFLSICAGMMLEHFYFEPKFSENVKSLLRSYNRNSIWQYIFDLIALIKLSFGKNEEHDYHNFIIGGNDDFKQILENYSINVEDYSSNTELQINYLGIRQKPLLKIGTDTYLVLNWKFFYRSIYPGTLFDFIKKSGNTYGIVKSIIGKKVLEERIFRGLFNYIWKDYYCKLVFPENENHGYPDCYLRIGKYVFLIEFKDYLLSKETIFSESFEEIKSHLDIYFIENKKKRKKGIKQLVDQVDKLFNNQFPFDDYQEKTFKRKNLVVFPIIITTSIHYQMPGINNYLSGKLSSMIPKDQLAGFNQVYPLTIIDFQFFYRQFNRIRKKEFDLREVLISYHGKIKSFQKINKKTPSTENTFKFNSSFEECLPSIVTKVIAPQKEPDFIEELFKVYNINPENSKFQQ